MSGDASGMDDVIERALRGDATEAELAALAAWRRASPANEREYRRAERLIASTRALRGPLAAAPPRPSAAAIIDAAATRRAARTGPGPARWAGWAVAAAAVAVLGLQLGRPERGAGWEPAEIVTGAAELATVKLGDGTVVRLAPSSRLSIEAGRTREVRLDGRAFFAVTRAPDGRPFRVHTSAAVANVLGTRFELATEPDGVRLMVIEGRVALDARRNTVEVGAGEQSGVRSGFASAPAPLADAEDAPAWLGRFLAFQATPLRDAAREIERLYDVRLVIEDAALADATITATFTDRTAADVLDVVCAVVNARCTASDGEVTVAR